MGGAIVAVVLGLVLAVEWILLSGRTTDTLTLTLGGASIIVVLILVKRLGILDPETAPQSRLPAYLRYWNWLGGEIVKANVAVTRIVMRSDLDVTPRVVRVRGRARTPMGRAVFANSVTLTPGTVTVAVEGDDMVVHALTADFVDEQGFEEMRVRAVGAAEGER